MTSPKSFTKLEAARSSPERRYDFQDLGNMVNYFRDTILGMEYLQSGQYLIKISLRNLLPWRRRSEFKRRLRVWGKEFPGLQVGFYESVFKFISQIKNKLQVVVIL